MILRLTLLFCTFLAFPADAGIAQSAEPDSASDTVVLYGPAYSFTVSTYDGWLIKDTGATFGKVARFASSTQDSAPAYGYVTVDRKPTAQPVTFAGSIEATLRRLGAGTPIWRLQ